METPLQKAALLKKSPDGVKGPLVVKPLEEAQEAFSWKFKMKNVVKYDVYLDMLLVGSIYVTKSVFFKESQKFPSSCKPCHLGLGTGIHV